MQPHPHPTQLDSHRWQVRSLRHDIAPYVGDIEETWLPSLRSLEEEYRDKFSRISWQIPEIIGKSFRLPSFSCMSEPASHRPSCIRPREEGRIHQTASYRTSRIGWISFNPAHLREGFLKLIRSPHPRQSPSPLQSPSRVLHLQIPESGRQRTAASYWPSSFQ